jgi:hypothetical protein
MFVTATIINYAEYELQEVLWSIATEGFVPIGNYYEGTISVPAGEKEEIQSGIILGFGPTIIIAKVPIRASDIMHKAQCFLLGPILLGMKEV